MKIINEYDKKVLTPAENKSIGLYLSNPNSNLIGSLENRNIYVSGENLYNRGSNVGILETNDGFRFEFHPKFDKASRFWEFLPVMMNSLLDLKNFKAKVFIDVKQVIKLPAGFNYVPFLALSYVSLCDKIIGIGLLKKYIRKNERLKSIRGKINFAELSRRQSWNLTSIPCSYFDLTFNNIENQFVLWGAYRLIDALSKHNITSSILIKLREQFQFLSQEIDLEPFYKHHASKMLNGTYPSYYSDIINLCKAILTESYFSLNNEEKFNKGLNFIIDMDWVYEQYMTKIFKEVCDSEYSDLFKIEDQRYSRNLGDKERITIKPDMIIRNKKNNSTISIIDFKWKNIDNKNNADYYQVICYALAELNKKGINKIPANLFCVSDTFKNETDYIEKREIDEISKVFGSNGKAVQIFKLAIPQSVFNLNDNEIENSIKVLISKYLKTLIIDQ